MEAWTKEPLQLDRKGRSISDATWDNMLSSILSYLGFLHYYMHDAAPTLECFLHLENFASFIAFQIDKGKTVASITQIISHTRKVLTFLSRNSSADLTSTVRWLDRLRQQLVQHIHRNKKDIGAMLEAGKWIEAGQMVALIHKFSKGVLETIPPIGPCSPAIARKLHDACLVSCMFGHLPPLRLVCLRTMQVPHVIGCLMESCRLRGCKGNRLDIRPGGALYMVFTHYKVDQK